MSGGIYVFAVPDPGDFYGGDDGRPRDEIRAAAAASGYQVVADYLGMNDLIDRIRQLLIAGRDCLRLLEIVAHGSPSNCNGIYPEDTLGKFADGLRSLTLCDTVEIYLSGCNTGLTRLFMANNALNVDKSIAQLLAEAVPFQSGKFEHHITVYGSRGYKSGTHMEDNVETTQTHLDQGQTTDFPMYEGAVNQQGADAWNAFKNWT